MVSAIHTRALTLTLLLAAPIAHASTIALVEPNCSTQAATETLSRLHGELLSVGLAVTRSSPPKSSDSGRDGLREWVTQLSTNAGVDAVIAIVCDPKPLTVDVWIIERNPRRIELSRVIAEPDSANASERLAIRTIDLLRSSFLANDIFGSGKQTDAKAAPKPLVVPSAAKQPSAMGVELGASVLTGTDGVGPALMPVIAIAWMPRPRFGWRGELSGFGSRPTVSSEAGHGHVAQHYGVVGASYRFGPHLNINPFISLSAGVLRTSVRGETEAPREGRDVRQWSLLIDGSVGASLGLTRRYYLTFAAHVQLAEPYVAIHMGDAIIATSGHPNIALTATFGAWL
jgi:hypothetical protein